MIYAAAHINNGVVDNVSVWNELPVAPDLIDITDHPQVSIGWLCVGGTFSAPPPDTSALRAQAQSKLDHITGARGTIVRCVVAGVAVPVEWRAYVIALRNIVNGTDITSTALPAMPAYPAGT